MTEMQRLIDSLEPEAVAPYKDQMKGSAPEHVGVGIDCGELVGHFPHTPEDREEDAVMRAC